MNSPARSCRRSILPATGSIARPDRVRGRVNRHGSADVVWCAHTRRQALVGPIVVVVAVALRRNVQRLVGGQLGRLRHEDSDCARRRRRGTAGSRDDRSASKYSALPPFLHRFSSPCFVCGVGGGRGTCAVTLHNGRLQCFHGRCACDFRGERCPKCPRPASCRRHGKAAKWRADGSDSAAAPMPRCQDQAPK